MKILNLYAGIGGNRMLWKEHEITAVEYDQKIADEYKRRFPKDIVFVEDAHQFLIEHYKEFDFIWSSISCVTHSRLNISFKNMVHKKMRYPDLKLYEEVLFLNHFFNGKWVVENVRPYYKPLIPPRIEMSNHVFWSNFNIARIELQFKKGDVSQSSTKVTQERICYRCRWLGVKEPKLTGVRNRTLVDNCVHPKIGLSILNNAIKSL